MIRGTSSYEINNDSSSITKHICLKFGIQRPTKDGIKTRLPRVRTELGKTLLPRASLFAYAFPTFTKVKQTFISENLRPYI